MRLIEQENKKLKGILPKNFARPELDKRRLGEVVDLFTNVKMAENGDTHDLLGRTYEYCLSQFAAQEEQERRRILYAGMRGENTGQRHRTLPRTRIRSRLRFGRHVRAVRRVRTQPSGQRQQHLRLWPGIEPDHMEDGQDEPLHPRHRRRPRPEERRHVLQRPTPHRTIRLHPGQPSVQHVGLGRRQAQGRSALGSTACRPKATRTSRGCSI